MHPPRKRRSSHCPPPLYRKRNKKNRSCGPWAAGTFNSISKVTKEVAEVWSRILKEACVPPTRPPSSSSRDSLTDSDPLGGDSGGCTCPTIRRGWVLRGGGAHTGRPTPPLSQVPEMRVVLKSKPLVCERVRNDMVALFTAHGIAADRIHCAGGPSAPSPPPPPEG